MRRNMYAGPVGSNWICNNCVNYRGLKEDNCLRHHPCFNDTRRAAFLHTGDAYLKKDAEWARLITHLGQARIDRVLGFQINHHGAAGNCKADSSQKIGAPWGIVSSDPKHYQGNHPSSIVIKDWGAKLLRVNTKTGVGLRAEIRV